MLNERNTLLEDDGIEEEILVEEECSVAQAVWGDILGNIENQTDLQNALDAKQDSLTEAQLSAVNSGITAGKVETYDGYADQIASKADQSALNAESVARGEADMALGTRIDNEALARQSVDNGLQTQIDAITSKSDVVDVVANYTALQAYDTSTLGNNDVVKVLDDETHEDALTYYRWSTTTQTWSYIGQEAPYYSKGQMDVMLQGKQDKLTAGANIQIQNGTISATDTTYTAGNGLNLNGTEFSADTDVLATKEDLEGYYTKPETDNLLAPKLEAEVVAELPTTGAEGKLYLTPKAHTTSTATGNPIEATVTEQAGQLESFQLDGDTAQQTYTGKNLLNLSASRDFTSGTDYSFDASSGVLTVTMSSAPAVNRYSGWYVTGLTPGAKYTFSIESFTNSALPNTDRAIMIRSHNGTSASELATLNKTQTSYTFTVPNDSVRLEFFFYIASGDTDSTSIITKPMLEAGETATTYEPFVGGQASPSPDYPQPIQTVTGLQTVEIIGKNLFNFIGRATDHGLAISYDTTTGTITVNGTAGSNYSNISDTVDLALEPGQTFTSSIDRKLPVRVATRAIYADGTEDSFIIAPGQTSTTWSPPKQVTRVRLYLSLFNPGDSYDLSFRFQLEAGSTATPYAPYSHQTLPLDLGDIQLCGLGDDGNGNPLYKDRIYRDGNDWKVHKDTGKYTFDGQEAWAWDSTIPRIYYNTATLESLGIYCSMPTSTSALPTALTTKFRGKTFGDFYTNRESNGFAMSPNGKNWNFGDKTWTKVSDGIAVITGTTVYYALLSAHKTDTVITDQTLIAQLEAIRTASLENGTNTITNSATAPNLAGDMEVGYYGFNPRNRYDKFIWLDLNNNYEQIGS